MFGIDILTLKKARQYTDSRAGLRRRIPVTTPEGFTWTDHPLVGRIWTDGRGNFETDFDVSELRPDTSGYQDYYVDRVSGSDSNSGLSPDAPLQSISAGLQKPDVGTLYVAPGVYEIGYGWTNNHPTRPFVVRKYGEGQVIVSYHQSLTWEPHGAIYRTPTDDRVRMFVDATIVDSSGDYLEYHIAGSVSEVEETPGSWHYDGTHVYVHTIDGRPPDSDVRGLRGALPNGRVRGDAHGYIEGIEFHGGIRAFQLRELDSGASIPSLYAKDCKFKYARGLDGVSVDGAGLIILQNCEASRNGGDGFSYHAAAGARPRIVEINCVGRDNGQNPSGSDQGSSCHNQSPIVRLNGVYFRNRGRNVADANDGTQSWNVGCVAFQDTAENGADFAAVNGAVEMWLDGCVSYGSKYSISDNSTSAIIRLRNFRADAPQNVSGTVEYY